MRLFVCKSHLKEAGGQELKYPIAKHHTKAHGGSDSTEKSDIETITLGARDGDQIKHLKQKESCWIYDLKS